MRGPSLRVKHDVRRLWKCPQCGYERYVPATATAVHCHCSREEPWMKLVEGQRKIRPPARPLDVYFDPEELLAEESASSCSAIPTEPAEPSSPSISSLADAPDELDDPDAAV